jgi:Cdc6-like AAA superfamily ATPase
MANQIVIKKGLKIGQLDAEADKDLLDVCFVDNGQLDELVDVSQPSSIIVGRTGAGKSALLHKISKSVEYSAILDPHAISIQFIENSNIIQFFNQLGVKLDPFYKLL